MKNTTVVCLLAVLIAVSGIAYTQELWTASVMDHGAKGDGATDDTAAFQAALDAASAKGGIVFAPAGTYLLAGSLTIPQGVTLRGVWEAPHHADIGKGTILYVTGGKGDENAAPFISLNQSSGVNGLTIFYPEQDANNVQPYPWCIQGRGMHGSVINVTLVNPYKGIDFGTHPNELHYISNVFGQPLRIGIFIDKTTDIGRVENVHFNPHSWARAAHPSAPNDDRWPKVQAYLNENFVGFLIGKTDWEYMRDCFCIFPKIGFHFIRTDAGEPNVVLTQCGADICPIAVRVDASQGHAGIAFENGQFMGTIVIGPKNNGPIKLTNCGFWFIDTTNEQLIVDGRGTVTLTSCHFAGWARQDREAPCIRVNGGSLIVNACDFFDETRKQFVIGEKAKGVVITASRLRGGLRIDKANKKTPVEISANLME